MYALFHTLFILFVILSSVYGIYIVIHLISWGLLPTGFPTVLTTPDTKITVIIPARNEEKNISNCLGAIATQTYPANLIEIIVVDDHSTDKTKELAEKALSQIKMPGKCISNSGNGKKSAISEAIRNSSGELLVITDADCTSNSTWLATLESYYKKTSAVMLCGPVQITREKILLEQFQSLELCGLSLLSAGGIKARAPLLCNGANMAYTRKVFNEIDGFNGIDTIPSGDDVLLLFKIQKKYPGKIAYVKSQDAMVSTSAQVSLQDFLSQRIRWASKGLTSNNILNSFVSMLVFSLNLISVAALVIMIARTKLYPLLVIGIGIKVAADFLLLLFATNFFNKKKQLWAFPIAEIITMLYISWVGIAANFASYSWKGRHYKHTR